MKASRFALAVILAIAFGGQVQLAALEESAVTVPSAAGESRWHIPVNLLGRIPLEYLLPRIVPPKPTDPRYDLTRIGDRGIGKGLDFYSLEKEIALGHELSLQLEQNAKIVKDPLVTEYVNRIAQRLVSNSDAQVPFTVKVIEDDQVNAFALPGGYFYVNTGLILAADNEAGLAGVMAHEIAHVAARHATKQATRSDVFNMVTIPLIFFGGPAGYAVRQVMGFAVPMSFLKFSRDAEREADMLGIEYAYQTGYDPQEFVKLFEKLRVTEKKKRNIMAKAFATHPMTDDRIKRAQSEIEDHLPSKDAYVVDTSEFEAVRDRVAELDRRHLILKGGDHDKPVLHKRGPDDYGTTSKNDASKSDSTSASTEDSDRPVLKKK